MSENTIAKYSFLPWLRQGIANNITTTGSEAGKLRAEIPIRLNVSKDGTIVPDSPETRIESSVALVGPGDIKGIASKAIFRTQPRNWITDFEPNFVPFVEFYDEDFPWRYTPAAASPATTQVKPWITLVVLEEGEFTENAATNDSLPAFTLAGNATDVFPAQDQLWAWAHVHVNGDLSAADGNKEINAALTKLQATLNANPDLGFSRLMCPRSLKPQKSYTAFLIPTFESGRLAGLGLELTGVTNAIQPAWGAGSSNAQKFPYYYKYFFRTSTAGDFEYLVRQLEARPVDKRVGVRPMDVQDPDPALPGITTPSALGLMGALRAPSTQETVWTDPITFKTALANRVNLAKTYQVTGTAGADPVITPPLYGQWHGLTDTLLPAQNGWVHTLNLDPRNRVPAGFGTEVVKTHQEAYMNEAWKQLGDVLAANQKIRYALLAKEVSFLLHKTHVQTLRNDTAAFFMAPLNTKYLWNGMTPHFSIVKSALPLAMVNPAMRTALRPRGPISKRFGPAGAALKGADLVQMVNDGKLSPTPPKITPKEIGTVQDLEKQTDPKAIPEGLEKLLSKWWFRFMPLFLLILLIILVLIFFRNLLGTTIIGVLTLVLTGLALLFAQWWKKVRVHNTFKPEFMTPESVKQLPQRPDFQIVEAGATVSGTPKTGPDNIVSKNFKAALTDFYTMFTVIPEKPAPRQPLNLPDLFLTSMMATNPLKVIPNRVLTYIKLPNSIVLQPNWQFKPVMAYPEFPYPMYEALRDASVDYLIPNVKLIPQNTISLLETNQKFIEAYMMGLNHEMARELLWREYPTDQRGSYFRQFWDVSGYLNTDPNLTEAQLAEKLKDIKPIHKWNPANALGSNNNRPGANVPQAVLVIRGDLLKKYPNTVIYARKAEWTRKNGKIDLLQPRKFAEGAQVEKWPLFGARIEPDIHFFGFDLTVPAAKGGPGTNEADDAGWFFVLEERPGEPRFGLDLAEVNNPPAPTKWNDLTWQHLQLENEHIRLGAPINSVLPANNPEGVAFSANATSADIAYVMYQDPVRIAVHAVEML